MTAQASLVRIGIVGCGNVLGAYMALAERLKAKEMADVVFACGRAHQKDIVLHDHRIPRFTTDYRELVRDPEVDLVVVLTSPRDHGTVARAALQAGKHVLVEKPMAPTLHEAAELVALARRSAGYLLCAPYVVLSPTYQAIGRRVRRGEIGRVVLGRARYGWCGPWWAKWFYEAGSGPLIDLGVYNVTSLTGILGPARRVMAMSARSIPDREVANERIRIEAEDNVQVVIQFDDVCTASVTTGFTIQKYRSPAFELYGTEGSIQMLGDDWDPEGYDLRRNDVGAWQHFIETDPEWPWTDGLRHIVECIRQEARPAVTPEHAYHVLEIMTKALAAGREGRIQEIESTFIPPVFEEPEKAEAAHLMHDRMRRSDPKTLEPTT
jgi:predicted dehydrogenase